MIKRSLFLKTEVGGQYVIGGQYVTGGHDYLTGVSILYARNTFL